MSVREIEPWESGPPAYMFDRAELNGVGHTMPRLPAAEAYRILTGRDLATPLPPIPWACQKLRLTAGAPTMFAGYGYSGKSVLLQSLALSVASGKDFLGMWPVEQGRVVHIDYEQGHRQTTERYQRLARASEVDLAALDDALSVHVLPPNMLNSDGAAAWLTSITEGAALCIVDSLAEGTSGLDENSADMRGPLIMAKRVSEVNGCAMIFVHHSRKPPSDVKAAGGARMAIRGSSAIYSALGGCFVMTGEKGEPVKVEHEKDRTGFGLLSDFYVAIEDVPHDKDARWGLRVVHMEPEQVLGAAAAREEKAVRGYLEPRIHEALLRQPGLTANALHEVLGGRKTSLLECLRAMSSEGKAAHDGRGWRVL